MSIDSARFVVIWEIGLYVRGLSKSLCVSWSHVMAHRVHSRGSVSQDVKYHEQRLKMLQTDLELVRACPANGQSTINIDYEQQEFTKL